MKHEAYLCLKIFILSLKNHFFNIPLRLARAVKICIVYPEYNEFFLAKIT